MALGKTHGTVAAREAMVFAHVRSELKVHSGQAREYLEPTQSAQSYVRAADDYNAMITYQRRPGVIAKAMYEVVAADRTEVNTIAHQPRYSAFQPSSLMILSTQSKNPV